MHIIKKFSSGKNILLFLSIALAVLILPSSGLHCQLRNFSVSFGLATTELLGNNPGALPMLEFDTTKVPLIGGSFDGNQPGLSFRANFGLDDAGSFVIPVGADVTFFHSAERVPISKDVTAYLKHWITAPTGIIGINYFFWKFPLANVRAYAGLEARANWILSGTFYRKIEGGDLDTLIETSTKPDAFRLGGAGRIGVEGEIMNPWYINTSCAWGVMNLFGRDDNRHELLTPTNLYETKESTVVNFLFSLMIQYKF